MARLFQRHVYQTDGSLAYKVGDRLVVEQAPKLNPLTKAIAARHRKVDQREPEGIPIFGIVGGAAVFILATVILGSLVQLNIQSQQLSELNSSMTELESQNALLTVQYDSIYTEDVLAAAAEEYGMSLAEDEQYSYVDLALPDSTTVYQTEPTVQLAAEDLLSGIMEAVDIFNVDG